MYFYKEFIRSSYQTLDEDNVVACEVRTRFGIFFLINNSVVRSQKKYTRCRYKKSADWGV